MNNLTDYQKRRLLENPNVEQITAKFVVFKASFKLKALSKYLAGEKPGEIFEKSNIPIHFFKKDYPRSCLKRWKKKASQKGLDSLKSDDRGSGKSPGRPKKPTYEELEAIVAIQREALGYAKD